MMETSIARVIAQDGRVAGAAFLVAPRRLVTCAHVVKQALQGGWDGDSPRDMSVVVDFPLVPRSPSPPPVISATVTDWRPPLPDNTDDLAILELGHEPPQGATPATLVDEGNLWDHPCRVFGFPPGRDQGVWVSGHLRSRQGAGWLQMESDAIGYAVGPGFSGSPVFDDRLSAVVGMTVAAESTGGPRAAYVIPISALVAAWPDLSEHMRPPCPYRGLSTFQEQDEALFFGREAYIRQVWSKVTRGPFAAVVGPSGTGKSSLVFAGILPLARRASGWTTVTMRPAQASSAVSALAVALLPLLEPGASETEQLAGVSRLTELLRSGHLLDISERVLARTGSQRLLVVVDQQEEIFARSPDDVREFIEAAFGHLVNDREAPVSRRISIIVTLRSDFLGPALQNPLLAQILQGSIVAVGQMRREQLREVITAPLPEGIAYEPGLIDRILQDVGEDAGSLPLLEFALTLLWERQVGGRLTHEAYTGLGGVKGAVAGYAERIYMTDMSEEEREQARRLLIQLVRPTDLGEPIRRVARRPNLAEAQWRLGQRLAGTRLLVADQDADGAETLELVHESVISGWSRLREWTDQDRDFRAWQERLRAAVAQWDASGHDPGALLRGVSLAEAQRWMALRAHEIPDAEQRFIRASTALQGRSVRRLRLVATGLAVLLAITAGVGAYAVSKRLDADRQARLAQSRYLVDQATRLEESQPALALLLAAAAHHLIANADTESALTRMASRQRFVDRLLPTGAASHVTFSPTDSRIIAIGGGSQVSLWDVGRGVRTATTNGQSSVGDLTFAADGRSLAFTEWFPREERSRIRLWYPSTGRLETVAEDIEGGGLVPEMGSGLHVGQDGRSIAACLGNSAFIWSIASGSRRLIARGPDNGYSSCPLVGFVDGGRNLLYTRNSQIWLWSVASGRDISAEGILVSEESNISMTPDGRYVLVQGSPGDSSPDELGKNVVWWDRLRHRSLSSAGLTALYSGSPIEVSFSGDSRTAVISGGTIVGIPDWKPLGAYPLRLAASDRYEGGPETAVLSADGRTAARSYGNAVAITSLSRVEAYPQAELAAHRSHEPRVTTVSSEGLVAVWDRSARKRITAFPTHQSTESFLAPVHSLSPDGRLYARVDRERIRLWDVDDPKPSANVVEGHRKEVHAVSFSPTGNFLAAADDSLATVRRVNDLKSPLHAVPLPPDLAVDSISVSTDGRLVAVGTTGEGFLWDLSSARPSRLAIPVQNWSQSSFSPDGRLIFFATGDDVVVWNVAKHQQIRRFRGAGGGALTLDRVGRLLATGSHSGSSTGSTIVRNVDGTGTELEFPTPTPLGFTPDGQEFVGAIEGVVSTFPLASTWALDHLCRVVARNLTNAEWSQYGGGFQYARIC